jgi:alpha-beta hydrolase superfamily lysophospholipase
MRTWATTAPYEARFSVQISARQRTKPHLNALRWHQPQEHVLSQDWLSRDEAMVDAYLADPLCGFGIDAGSARDMFAGARRLADPAEVARMPRYLPLYIAVGAKDPVNADLALLWPLVDRYRDAGLCDVTIRVYEDARHEVLNEINRRQVIDDLQGWLRRPSVVPPRETGGMTRD